MFLLQSGSKMKETWAQLNTVMYNKTHVLLFISLNSCLHLKTLIGKGIKVLALETAVIKTWHMNPNQVTEQYYNASGPTAPTLNIQHGFSHTKNKIKIKYKRRGKKTKKTNPRSIKTCL